MAKIINEQTLELLINGLFLYAKELGYAVLKRLVKV